MLDLEKGLPGNGAKVETEVGSIQECLVSEEQFYP